MDEILELLWPDRADLMGLVFGLGLVTEEYNIFPNILQSQPQYHLSSYISQRNTFFFLFFYKITLIEHQS
jgi:hypothetical protein